MSVSLQSLALEVSAKSPNCPELKVFERKGVVVIAQPLFWLTRTERSVIIDQVEKHRRCVATVTVDREVSHMLIVWKGTVG